jgi:hypothetical protein
MKRNQILNDKDTATRGNPSTIAPAVEPGKGAGSPSTSPPSTVKK